MEKDTSHTFDEKKLKRLMEVCYEQGFLETKRIPINTWDEARKKAKDFANRVIEKSKE